MPNDFITDFNNIFMQISFLLCFVFICFVYIARLERKTFQKRANNFALSLIGKSVREKLKLIFFQVNIYPKRRKYLVNYKNKKKKQKKKTGFTSIFFFSVKDFRNWVSKAHCYSNQRLK